ncbi:MAG: DUF4956 domain-containing protein [Lachnospiraceae bacterium]
MDYIFNEVLTFSSNDLTFASDIITMLIALALGLIVAFTYYKTQDEDVYQRSLAITLCMLPIILSVVIVFIGSDIARAFSLAGTLSIIRFRSAPGDSKDIGFIFFDIAVGLACGVGLYGYGCLFVVVLCAFIIILEKRKAFEKKDIQKLLKITIPENLNYQGVFDDILHKYTKKYSMSKIKTTDLGSLFEVTYTLTMDGDVNEQEFINELRCRNGNLSIVLSVMPKIIK